MIQLRNGGNDNEMKMKMKKLNVEGVIKNGVEGIDHTTGRWARRKGNEKTKYDEDEDEKRMRMKKERGEKKERLGRVRTRPISFRIV